MGSRITLVNCRVVYNSRGEETVEVEVHSGPYMGRASAPAGASVGKSEAVAFGRGGAEGAASLLSSYKQRLIGFPCYDIDGLSRLLHEIDGTMDFSSIGGSMAYAITFAAAEAAAKSEGLPLYRFLGKTDSFSIPRPLGNVLGGGKHAGPASPSIQEFLALPIGAPKLKDALLANLRVHRAIGVKLEELDPSFTGGKGDEGAWAPRLDDERALELVCLACKEVSNELGFEVRPGIDFAASSLWNEREGVYEYRANGRRLDRGEQIEYVIGLVKEHGLVYIEDPLHEEDFDGLAELTAKLKGCLIAGDDIFVTNVARLKRASSIKAGNSTILKVNQVGTLGEAMAFSAEAKRLGYQIIVSHRSGETNDAHISHLAVALRADLIKAGVVGGERVAKLNELIRISEDQGIKGLAKLDLS